MDKRVYTIDGTHFNNLQGFYEEISSVLIPGASWGRNLDAFNDILWGGFGTPDEDFILVWKNSDRSRQVLGYKSTVDYFEEIWQRTAQNRPYNELAQRDYQFFTQVSPELDEIALQALVEQSQNDYMQLEHKLEGARNNRGDTVFDWLVRTIREHPDIELRFG